MSSSTAQQTPPTLCILAPVYHPYRWVAPHLQRCLAEFWPDHPPLFFCGLTAEEAGSLPVLPLKSAHLPRAWAAFVRDAIDELSSRGFTKCYLILEEHLPLDQCHSAHLNHTLPRLLDDLDAAYIGLMGWDNRRYATRAPILGADRFHFMHLTPPSAPRFHLHPSLWRIEALRACLDLTLQDDTHTPWRFEKIAERADAKLPERWKKGCYQVCGRELSARKFTAWETFIRRAKRAIFLKLMSVFPLLPQGLGKAYWHAVGFDRFIFEGPYPMFFSGVMAKGGLNSYFVDYMKSQPHHHALIDALLAARASHTP